MDYTIEKIDANNHSLFDDMVFWRENGFEREPTQEPVSNQIKKELLDPDLFVYAVKVDGRYVGWISCVYIAKVGKWKGHGHIYVDELWVEPSFRGNGFAKALLRKADELKDKLEATGIRLYANVNNPVAQNLYETCGYVEDGRAIFMEK